MRCKHILFAATPVLAACTAAQLHELAAPPGGATRAQITVPGFNGRTVTEAEARAAGVRYGDLVTGMMTEGATATYTFSGNRGDALTLYMETVARGDTPPAWVGISVHNTTGQIQLGGTSSEGRQPIGANPSRRIELTETGLHTIRVIPLHAGFGRSGPYRFILARLNDAPETHSATIRLGEMIEGERLDHPNDYDEFKFEGVRGQRLVVQLQTGPTPAYEGYAMIYTAAGEHIGGAASSGDVPLEDSRGATVTLPHTGRYTLRVSGRYTAHGPYRAVIREAR